MAELVKYNANIRGNNAGDCVKRSLSIAYDIPYSDIEKELHSIANGRGEYNEDWVWERFLKSHTPSVRKENVTDEITLEDFADQHNTGTYLISCGKRGDNHLVCIIDGVIYDSWDSRDTKVYSYYQLSGNKTSREFYTLSDKIDDLSEMAQSMLKDKYAQITKNAQDYPLTTKVEAKDDYSFKIELSAPVSTYSSITEKPISYKEFISVPYVFTPNTSAEKAKEMVLDITNTVGARKIRNLLTNIKNDVAEGEMVKKGAYVPFHMSSSEQRLYNWLPMEIKEKLKGLRIQREGQYSDSVKVSCMPLSWDNYTKGVVYFEHYYVADVKDMIKRYVKKHEIAGRDYDPFSEY